MQTKCKTNARDFVLTLTASLLFVRSPKKGRSTSSQVTIIAINGDRQDLRSSKRRDEGANKLVFPLRRKQKVSTPFQRLKLSKINSEEFEAQYPMAEVSYIPVTGISSYPESMEITDDSGYIIDTYITPENATVTSVKYQAENDKYCIIPLMCET